MKYVVFSDLHLHSFNDYAKLEGPYNNTRLENQVKALDDILAYAQKEQAIVLFLGDLYHQRGKVTTAVFNAGYETFYKYRDVTVYAIEGNHDNVTNSINSDSTLEPFKYLDNFHLVETYDKFSVGSDSFIGVSYGEEYEELKSYIRDHKATVLLGHLGVEGSYGAGMSKLDGPFSTGDLKQGSNYELVLLGHYHRRQELAHNVYYVGNPVAQDFGDSELEKGFYTFTTDNGHVIDSSIMFHKLNYPMFYKITKDNIDKYQDIPSLAEHNYVRVLLDEKSLEEIKLLGEDEDMPDNIRLEKTVESVSDSRISIDESSTILDIAEKWASEFQPDNKDIVVQQIKKVL